MDGKTGYMFELDGTIQTCMPLRSNDPALKVHACRVPGCDKAFIHATSTRRHERIDHGYYRRGGNASGCSRQPLLGNMPSSDTAGRDRRQGETGAQRGDVSEHHEQEN